MEMDKEKMMILPLKEEFIKDINKTNDSFQVFGKVIPELHEGKWSFKEALFEETKQICFPEDKLDWAQYMNNDDKALFLAYWNKRCIGQIRMIRAMNHFCYIENVATVKEYRQMGVGKRLLHRAEEWARNSDLIGLSLETQDDNLGACRFYVKQGFVLGGVDTLKQFTNPEINTTLYWYKLFM